MRSVATIKTALEAQNIAVFMPGEHPGVCLSPYCVIQPMNEMRIGRHSHGTGIIRLHLYAPVGRFDKLDALWQKADEVLTALSDKGDIRYTGERGTCLIDDAFRAVTCFADVTVQFGA